MSHAGEIVLGLLGTVFFTLLWRRMDKTDNRLDRIEARITVLGDELHEIKGRIDEISKHV